MASRELFTAADGPRNFYMQGSMGHAMAMGLGVALSSFDGLVVILDGDGSALMHMGSMATVGERAPRRFLHVIIDNEVYGTTGNQSTASSITRLDLVANACGYARVARCDNASGLRTLMAEFRAVEGPTCLVVKVNHAEIEEIPRITSRYTPEQTAMRVRREIMRAGRMA
jgi:phosphonopyruvate decarboxylase